MAAPIAVEQDNGVQDDDQYEVASYTTSIASSITDYKYEHGRRYHAYQEGRYALPNDEDEQNRMDLQYHAMRLAFDDKPFFAPVAKLERVLDAGTGTGIWAEDVADAHPTATIHGIDLSPIQPRWSPPNIRYQIDDLESPWTFPPNHFSLIHTRIMLGSLRNWPLFFSQSFRHLQPGGWIECQELDVWLRTDDGSLPEGSAIGAWCRNQEEAAGKVGMSLRCTGDGMAGQMREAGFVDVTIREFKLPIGQWPKEKNLKEAGAFGLVAMLGGIEGLTMAFWTRFLGWKAEDVEAELVKVKREFQTKAYHGYWPAYVVYGKKPEGVDPGTS